MWHFFKKKVLFLDYNQAWFQVWTPARVCVFEGKPLVCICLYMYDDHEADSSSVVIEDILLETRYIGDDVNFPLLPVM